MHPLGTHVRSRWWAYQACNVLSKQVEFFLSSMHKEQRKARAWGLFVDHLGFCHARWSLIVHCDRCTPRRALLLPRVLQEVRWLGVSTLLEQSQRAPPSETQPHHHWLLVSTASLCAPCAS